MLILSLNLLFAAFRVGLSGGVGKEANTRGGEKSQKPPASTHLLLWPEHHGQRPGPG